MPCDGTGGLAISSGTLNGVTLAAGDYSVGTASTNAGMTVTNGLTLNSGATLTYNLASFQGNDIVFNTEVRAMTWDVEWTASNLATCNREFGKRFGL